MGQWVVTVAGIAILAVLCDIILPDGQTRKYVKTVIGVVVTLVMIQPVINFANGSFSANGNISSDYANVEIQQSYLDMVDDKQIAAKITAVQDSLSARGVLIEVKEINKNNKTIEVQSSSSFSTEVKSIIDKEFKAYFADYKITIKWK